MRVSAVLADQIWGFLLKTVDRIWPSVATVCVKYSPFESTFESP